MISLERAQQSIKTLIGQAIYEATILKYVMQWHHALADGEQAAMEQVMGKV